MTKRVTITIDEAVYDGLMRMVGERNISRFLEDLARPHLTSHSLDEAYADMAADAAREQDAQEWSDALIGDAGHAAR